MLHKIDGVEEARRRNHESSAMRQTQRNPTLLKRDIYGFKSGETAPLSGSDEVVDVLHLFKGNLRCRIDLRKIEPIVINESGVLSPKGSADTNL